MAEESKSYVTCSRVGMRWLLGTCAHSDPKCVGLRDPLKRGRFLQTYVIDGELLKLLPHCGRCAIKRQVKR